MLVKKLFALSTAVYLTAAVAGAQDARDQKQTPEARPAKPSDPQKAPIGVQSGTVRKIDPVAKSATVEIVARDGASAGTEAKETVMCWDETTRIEGGPIKEGDSVQFKTVDKQGRACATFVKVAKSARPQSQ